MFSVLFEAHPKSEQWDAYLNYAKMLHPELEVVEGSAELPERRVYAACGSSGTTACMIGARRLSIIRTRRTV